MKKYILNHLLYFLLAVLFVFIFSVRFLFVHHFGVVPWCPIYVEASFVQGDRGEIKKSLQYLRANDYDGYMTVCSHIDTIVEKVCYIGTKQTSNIPDACYVRGTHTIYLAPQAFTGMSTEKRANLILKYAEFSRDFWEQK